jgi:hypothetical protein
VEERERRLGRNEALFREVNERIERVSGALRTGTDTMTILCECGNPDCVEHIEVSLSEYERIRGDSTHFFVRPGHAKPDVEEVIEHHDEYDVVRKNGAAAEIARELDPRDGDD